MARVWTKFSETLPPDVSGPTLVKFATSETAYIAQCPRLWCEPEFYENVSWCPVPDAESPEWRDFDTDPPPAVGQVVVHWLAFWCVSAYPIRSMAEDGGKTGAKWCPLVSL